MSQPRLNWLNFRAWEERDELGATTGVPSTGPSTLGFVEWLHGQAVAITHGEAARPAESEPGPFAIAG